MSDLKASGSSSNNLGIMDKAWEHIQKKTFTKWCNMHLAKRGQALEDIKTDFGDGLKLISFLEIISGKPNFSKYEKNPKIRIKKIQNLVACLNFIKEQGVHLISISAEDIADGNLKLILGMIWTIIQKFQIEDISEEQLSAKEALLLWCKKKTTGYKGVAVDNFHTSWVDGLAFCALIHKHRPDLIDFASLSKEDPRGNLQLAFDVAQNKLGIAKLLDIEDLIDVARPDERSVITYVSQYYHVFNSNRKQEVAARRIGRIVDLTSTNDQLKSDYSERAQKLVDWIKQNIEIMQNKNLPDNLNDLKEALLDFLSYKNNDKPEKAAEKLSLEALFNSIAMKLKTNNKAAFVPPEGTSPNDISTLWQNLNTAEREREEALLKELERQEKLDLLNKRFNSKINQLEAWVASKEQYMAVEEQVDSLNKAQEKLKQHESFYPEYNLSKSRLNQVQEIAQEISSLNGPNAKDIQERTKKLTNNWNSLSGLADSKKSNLKKKLEVQQRMESLRIEFTKHVKEYNRWVAAQIDDASDYSFGETLEQVQEFKKQLSKENENAIKQSIEKKTVLENIWKEIQELGITDLKYTVLTIKEVENRHNSLLEAIKNREIAYEAEVERQNEMENKRIEYSKAAQSFIDHLSQRRSTIEKLQGEPEALTQSILQTYDEGQPEKLLLEEINKLSSIMLEMGINENRHTELNSAILSTKSDQFGTFIKNYVSSLAEEKEMKEQYIMKATEISEWVNSSMPFLKEREFDNTLSGAQQKHSDLNKFKTGKKAEFSAKKPEIERLFSSISLLLSKNKRPEFSPPLTLTLANITALWNLLEDEEKHKEDDVKIELARQEKLAMLARRFQSDAEDIESWQNEKEKYLNEPEEIDSLFKAQFSVKLFEAFSHEFDSRESRLQSLNQLVSEIVQLNYMHSDTITSRAEKISSTWNLHKELAKKKKDILEEELQVQQNRENLRIEYSQEAKEYNLWFKTTIEQIRDYNFGFSQESVVAYKEELVRSETEITNEANSKKNSLELIWNEVQSFPNNQPFNFTFDDAQNLFERLTAELRNRSEAYDKELERQNLFEDKRKDFAQKAQAFVDFLAEQRSLIEKIEGEKITKITEIYQEGSLTKPHLDSISTLASEMISLGIYGNRHTSHSLPSLISRNNQFNSYIKSLLSGLAEEKEMQERLSAQEVELAKKQEIENMILQFSRSAGELIQWLENSEDILNDPINVDTVEDVERLINEFSLWEQQNSSKSTLHSDLVELASKMKSESIDDFSGVTIEDITAKWNSAESMAVERKSALQVELEKQKSIDIIRKEFASNATAFSTWLHQQKETLVAKGELEEQLNLLSAERVKVEKEGKEKIQVVEGIHKKAESNGIKNYKYTDLSLRTLTVEFEQLKTAIDKQEKLLTNEIMMKKNADVSVEQLQEFKDVFHHFDRDGSGTLERKELKACLQSLGEEPTDTEMDSIMAEIDPNKTGKINFESFTQFMVSRTKDNDTQDEILDSFKSIANDKEFVTEEDMRKVLTDEKVKYLMQHAPAYPGVQGGYDYKKWISTAFKS